MGSKSTPDRAIIMSLRSRTLVWTLAGTVAVAVAAFLVVVFIVDGKETGDGAPPPGLLGAGETTATSLSPLEAEPTVPSTRPTSTSSLASTTTAPPSTTTSAPLISSPSGYTAIPKPSAGPNTVAPGGALTKHLAEDVAQAFGFGVAAVEAAVSQVELPPEAGDNPEGWLAPGTYDTGEGATPSSVVQAMVDRRVAQLEERNVPRDQWHRVVTAASVIEKETYNQSEKPKVARVLTNRLAGGGPLQMDSIILYPVPEDRIFTTSEERASDQPYNSYRHNGLPPTPICSPDEASIDAFLAPPPGDWWFYVTIDLHTGETRFAVTYQEHLDNVQLLRAWLRENPTP